MRMLVAAASAMFLSVFSVGAAEYTPAQILQATPINIEGRTFDILGLTLGMSAAEVQEWYTKSGLEIRAFTESSTLSIRKDGQQVSTTPFISTLSYENPWSPDELDREKFVFRFTGPASGNQLIEIRRSMYETDLDQRPLVEDVVAALAEKYGEPNLMEDNGLGLHITWRLKDGRPFNVRNHIDREGYQLDALQRIAQEELDGGDLLLKITVSGSPRFTGMSMMMRDMKRVKEAAAADMQSLLGEADRQMKELVETAPKTMVKF